MNVRSCRYTCFMNCLTCQNPLELTWAGLPDRRRKYCSNECKPKHEPKLQRRTTCAHCQEPIAQTRKAGYPKLYCDRQCANLANAEKAKARRQRTIVCDECGNTFSAAGESRRFCSKDCRYNYGKRQNLEKAKQYFANIYPNGVKQKICRWCHQPMEVSAKRSYSGRLYHPDCSKEAEKARYRMKVVKRQKQLNPQRISHEQVVREYGTDCHICQQPIDLDLPRTSKLGLTVDHLIPLSRGGSDTMDNLRPAHWTCNRRKSDKLMEELSA